jgi:hypothetical protein
MRQRVGKTKEEGAINFEDFVAFLRLNNGFGQAVGAVFPRFPILQSAGPGTNPIKYPHPPLRPTANSPRHPASPNLRPTTSPELRPTSGSNEPNNNELDDEELAFPNTTLDIQEGDPDEPSDTCDFSKYFGGTNDADSYDDEGFMDELDGIPLIAR